MVAQPLLLNGKRYVVIPHEEYDGLAKAAQLPPLPDADAEGNRPAVEFGRATIAREIILDRIRLGLTQRELAHRAGVRVETLCRIESGKVTPTITSIDKIDRAIKQVEAERSPQNNSVRKRAVPKNRRAKPSQRRRR